MDPNATLQDIRSMVAALHASVDDFNNPSAADDAEIAYELADRVHALDVWLSKGGFLPDEWNYAARNDLQGRSK